MNPILSVPEYLMLEYAPTFFVGDNEFQMFWKYKYEVDANDVLLALERKNLICEDGIKKSVESATIPELKNILNENHLTCNGRKSDLVIRLLQELDFETLNIYFPYRYYKLSELGEYHKQTLEFQNVLAAHRHPDYQVSADEIPTGMTFNDYVWGQLNKRSLYYYNKKQWGLYRNTRHLMGELLSTENKPEKAFPFYIEVCVCDMLDSFIAPGIYEHLNKLRKKIGCSDDDLFNYVEISLESLTIPTELEDISDIAYYITQKIIDFTYEPSERLHINATERL